MLVLESVNRLLCPNDRFQLLFIMDKKHFKICGQGQLALAISPILHGWCSAAVWRCLCMLFTLVYVSMAPLKLLQCSRECWQCDMKSLELTSCSVVGTTAVCTRKFKSSPSRLLPPSQEGFSWRQIDIDERRPEMMCF